MKDLKPVVIPTALISVEPARRDPRGQPRPGSASFISMGIEQ